VTNPYEAKTDSDQVDEVGMVVFCVVDFEQDESPMPIWIEQAERQGGNSGAKEPVRRVREVSLVDAFRLAHRTHDRHIVFAGK
jgi:hypothetical protein